MAHWDFGDLLRAGVSGGTAQDGARIGFTSFGNNGNDFRGAEQLRPVPAQSELSPPTGQDLICQVCGHHMQCDDVNSMWICSSGHCNQAILT